MRIFAVLSIFLTTILFNQNVVLAGKSSTKSTSNSPYQQAFDAISKRDWPAANIAAKKAKNRPLAKIVKAEQIKDSYYTGNNFADAAKFITNNPNWAQIGLLKLRAESMINDNTDKKLVYNWFMKNSPRTGHGYKHYAYAAASVTKDPTILIQVIKDGWIYGEFGKDEQKQYHKRFKKYLSQDDHVKKIDHMLMNGRITSARNSLYLVSKAYKESFNAQIALIGKKKGGWKHFRSIKPKYITPGLVLAYLNTRKTDLPHSNEVVKLIKYAKKQPELGDRFYAVQAYIAREYLERKEYKAAYKIISSHFAKSASDFSSAEFMSGWLALSFLKKPGLAHKHFMKFNTVVKTPISIARGLYWLGRSDMKLGKRERAMGLFAKASTKYPYTFYGQAAGLETGSGRLNIPGNIDLAHFRNDNYFRSNDLFPATILVAKYGSKGLAQQYLGAAAKAAGEPKKILAVAYEVNKINNNHYKVWYAKKAMSKGVFIKNMNYPVPFQVQHLPIESALTMSIIRQESVFDQHAVSSANAHGLMQLIKSTACSTAKKIQMQCQVSKLTRDPKYNITLGSNHLHELVQEYGSYYLAAAAYNAGGHRVDAWLKKFGDPRMELHHHDVIDWLELIPFYETRNYVQRVLENVQVYRAILKQKPNVHLADDLVKRKKL